MNKKAFTLIELLAVIVILAIISLIAVPIVINIINDSKTSSDEQSVELYLDTVQKAITKKQMSDPNFNPDKCKILTNGDLKCYKNNELLDTMKIEMKGKTPYKGEITILNNKFNYKNIWFNNKKYYFIATLLDDADNNKEISIGDKYSYKVNDTDTFDFYVLSFNEDDTVNLIMDRNICEDGTTEYENNNYCKYAWHLGQSDSNYGPDTAMTVVYNATKNWTNVPDIIIDFKDNNSASNLGYLSIKTDASTKVTTIIGKNNKVSDYQIFGNINFPLKARLPKTEEVTSTNLRCTTNGNSCLQWLVDNKTNMYENDVYGYWLLNSSYSNIIYATVVEFSRNISYGKQTTYAYYGIRPVITVPIDDLN